MRVLIVGLPYFAKRVHADLSAFDTDNTYFVLDTYENWFDKLKTLFLLPNVDLIYSINGSISHSLVFSLAMKLRKKLVMHWVGTDVVKSRLSFKNGDYNQSFITGATHLCEVDWIQEELKEIGVHAEVINFANFEVKQLNDSKKLKPSFYVLAYVANHRPAYYGMEKIIELANLLPQTQFKIAGLETFKNIPDNIELLGWVNNMDELIRDSGMCLRCTEHDGLSSFVLEALAAGKIVAYNNDFPHCLYTPDMNSLVGSIKNIEEKHRLGGPEYNKPGREFIELKFSKVYILSTLRDKLMSTANG
ncbi:MAG: hypothetical protein COB85_06985 [Bacteroidetes bacterium]|nr:MAG: hypothetical protein COB85_06985 [Bacteroidota bacterium]